MSKSDKEFYWRMQGMLFALSIVKNGGAEALEREIRMRNITKAPLSYTEKQVKEFYQTITKNVYNNMLSAMMWTLHDSFQFGRTRLQRLKADFYKNTEAVADLDYMGQRYVRLEDYAIELNQKYNLNIDVDCIAACQSQYDEKDEATRMCRIDRVLEVMRNEGFTDAAAFLESKLE